MTRAQSFPGCRYMGLAACSRSLSSAPRELLPYFPQPGVQAQLTKYVLLDKGLLYSPGSGPPRAGRGVPWHE